MTGPVSNPNLDAVLKAMGKDAGKKMTPAEIQQQRISFAFGTLPDDSPLTKADVAEMDYAQYGNLLQMERELNTLRGRVKLAALAARISSIEEARDMAALEAAKRQQKLVAMEKLGKGGRPRSKYRIARSEVDAWQSIRDRLDNMLEDLQIEYGLLSG